MPTFAHPAVLWWGIPLGALLFVMMLRSAAPLSPARALAALATRALLLLLVLGALAGPERLRSEPEPYALLYLVDLSASVSDTARESALAHLATIAERVCAPHARQALIPVAGRADVLALASGLEPFPGPEALRHLTAATESRRLAAEAVRVLEGNPAPDARAAAEARMRESAQHADWLARLEPGRTDLDDALTLAVNLFPEVTDRRILVYTDANVNAGRFGRGSLGDSPGGGRLGAGVKLALLPLGDEGARDVVAEKLELPSEVRVGQAFDARVTLSSHSPLAARVALLIDDVPTAEQEVTFPARGVQSVVVPTLTRPAGVHRCRAAASAPDESERRNNKLLGAVLALGRERVLVAEAVPGAGANVAAALAAQDVAVERMAADALPTAAGPLAAWGAVVLVEAVHGSLARDQWRALQAWVADGGGLLLLSGTDARALAGFKGSPEEALLPVAFEPPRPDEPQAPPTPQPDPRPRPNPDPTKKEPRRVEIEVPSVSLLLVIDKSGSMAEAKKMTLAKEAAIAAAEALGPEDRIGVLAFDEKPRWVVEFTPARKRTYIQDRVARIVAGGGTDIYPALEEGGTAIAKEESQVRHIVLLTDGVSPMADFQTLVSDLARRRITVSAIGVGDDIDGSLLSGIARWGRGRYFVTSSPDEVPQIFHREARTVVRSVPQGPRPPVSEHAKPEEPATTAVDPGGPPPGPDATAAGPGTAPGAPGALPGGLPGGAGPGTGLGGGLGSGSGEGGGPRGPFKVVPVEPGDILKGIPPAELPDLGTFARSTVRRQAMVALLAAGEDRPLLAYWRYELGKVAVWTSDLRGEAAAAWLAWGSFPKFVAQLARSVGRSAEERMVHPRTEVRYEGAEAVVTVEAPEEREAENLAVETRARWSAPEGRPEPVAVEKIGVGRYRARAPVPKVGTIYTLEVSQKPPHGPERSTTLGLARPYEEEYHDLGTDTLRVEGVARRLGAAVGPSVEDLSAVRPRRRTERDQLAWVLLALAALLLPADVAVRRLGI
ncbi:MAG: VWA domain-containing protein [Planctomycetes bacterium]|nr:VWA domain-containing protein [Planctomycetota bacterium]